MKPYEFLLDRSSAVLRVTLRGFWDLATMDAYEPRFHEELVALDALRPTPTSCLVDATEYPVQSYAITERHRWLVANLGRLRADRAALVVGTQLVRMQAARGLPDDRMRVFDREDDALAWLGCVRAFNFPPQLDEAIADFGAFAGRA
jgi:hypothetical protein